MEDWITAKATHSNYMDDLEGRAPDSRHNEIGKVLLVNNSVIGGKHVRVSRFVVSLTIRDKCNHVGAAAIHIPVMGVRHHRCETLLDTELNSGFVGAVTEFDICHGLVLSGLVKGPKPLINSLTRIAGLLPRHGSDAWFKVAPFDHLQRTPFVTLTVRYLFAVDVTECTFSYLCRQDCFVPFVTGRGKKIAGSSSGYMHWRGEEVRCSE